MKRQNKIMAAAALAVTLSTVLPNCNGSSDKQNQQTPLTSNEEYVKSKKDSKLDVASGALYESYEPAPRILQPSEGYNRDSYNQINENPFHDAKKVPLSTFSVDVDTASYSNVRRYINEGVLPPKDSVRIEEMVNYFNYSYDPPSEKDGHPFAVHTELTTSPWSKGNYLLKIGIKAKTIEASKMPQRNFVFLLDVSGSMMGEDRLGLVKKAMKMLVEQLGEKDRISIVVYAGSEGVALEPTPGSNKQKILEALDNLSAGGSTNGGAGIERAYKMAQENFRKEGINRVILATDGDFNLGVSDEGSLVRLIEKKRESGVFLTVLGFGRGNFQDDKMEQLANKGNGNIAYIDSISEAKKVLVHEAASNLVSIAKDVKIQVEFNPKEVSSYRLIGYENRLLNDEDFNDDTKDAGEIGAGHNVTALYEIVPAGLPGKGGNIDPLKYQGDTQLTNAAESKELGTVKIRYKQPQGEKSILLSRVISAKPVAFESASEDLRFASAVAMYSLVVRDSEFKGESTFDKAYENAKSALGKDPYAHRAEFLTIIRKTQDIKPGTTSE